MDKLLKIINTMLKNSCKEEKKDLTNEMDLRNDFGFDSMDLAELTVRIEKDFGIDIFSDGIVSNIGEIKEKLGI